MPKITFTKPLGKKSPDTKPLVPRTYFKAEKIPQSVKGDESIEDQTHYLVEVVSGSWRTTRECNITSGGEIGLGKKIHDKLVALAKKNPNGEVTFTLCPLTASDYYDTLAASVDKSRKDTSKNRKARLNKAKKKPKKIIVATVVYQRNPDVIAEVLSKAKGKCGKCKNDAPFKRKKDTTPFLEVHHKKRLADGGDDTVDNAIALCPNCHREQHYG